jgi:hypothetical protein
MKILIYTQKFLEFYLDHPPQRSKLIKKINKSVIQIKKIYE